MTSSIKLEVHNIAQRRQRRTEPRPQGICTQNFVRLGPAVPEICSRTDRQTDRRVDHSTPHPYRGGSYNVWCDAVDSCCCDNADTKFHVQHSSRPTSQCDDRDVAVFILYSQYAASMSTGKRYAFCFCLHGVCLSTTKTDDLASKGHCATCKLWLERSKIAQIARVMAT